MIRVLLFLLVLVALAFAGAWIADQPGGIALTVGGDTIEMSLWAGVAALVAAAVALVLLWWAVRTGLRLPQTIGFAARARRRARGFAAISRGMIAVGAGDPRSARRHAEDAGKLLGNEPLALLLKAQAAQMTGDRPSAEGAFRQMLDEPETRVLGLRGLFVEARRKGDAPAARAYAAEAARLSPSVAWAGEALLEYQCADGDWTGALGTLERGSRALDKASYRRQRAVLLTADAMARTEREPEAALAKAQEAVKLAPDLVPAAALAARLMARRGDLRKAAKTIEAAWKSTPHPELASAYVSLRPGDAARDRLSRADKLLALSQHHAEARIAVAGAAIDARDFRRARQVLEPLVRERPTVRVCLLMADIAEADGQSQGEVREWLGRAARAPRDPAWIADGIISERWAPVSPVTGRLDAFTWGTPVERLAGSYAAEAGVAGERAERAPGDRAILAVPATDVVLADVDEPLARELPPPVPRHEAPAAEASSTGMAKEASGSRPAPAAAEAAPPPDSPPSPAQAETAPTSDAAPAGLDGPERPADAKTVADASSRSEPGPVPAANVTQGAEAMVETEAQAHVRGRLHPTPVVFPMPAPPDDPGTDPHEASQGTRSRFLQ